ncbi:MAG: hypothetical protein QME79_02300 [Bacillota bacterium]|nr:hypothetical protein [Bacillota bacterium]
MAVAAPDGVLHFTLETVKGLGVEGQAILGELGRNIGALTAPAGGAGLLPFDLDDVFQGIDVSPLLVLLLLLFKYPLLSDRNH